MILKEYPAVKKNNKVIIPKTTLGQITFDFITQMRKRGNTGLAFFINYNQLNSEQNNEEEGSSFCWDDDFKINEFMNLIIGFMNSTMNSKQKTIFMAQLQNNILSDLYNNEDDEDLTFFK